MKSLFLLLASLLTFPGIAPANQSPGEDTQNARHCTIGEVASILQVSEVAIHTVTELFSNIKLAGLGSGVNCQYRLFIPVKFSGSNWAFCEDDVFLGGIVWLYGYQAAGISRQESIDTLDKLESVVYFGPISGTQSELSLIRTGYKNFIHPSGGLAVYRQEAFITQQEPGNYLSIWSASFDGTQIDYVEFEVEVVTHEEHLQRVEDGTWRTWF